MKASLVAVTLVPAIAAAQAATGPDAGKLPYLWLWILVSAVVLLFLGYLLFGPAGRERARAHAAHRARREMGED